MRKLFLLLVVAGLLQLVWWGTSFALKMWVVGEEDRSWESVVGTVQGGIDTDSRPGWLQPLAAGTEVNLAVGVGMRGGGMWDYARGNVRRPVEKYLTDMDSTTVWLRADPNGVIRPGDYFYVDLGAAFLLNRIVLAPMGPNKFMRGYTIYVTDEMADEPTAEALAYTYTKIWRSFEVGRFVEEEGTALTGGKVRGVMPTGKLLVKVPVNELPDIEVSFLPQRVRYLQIINLGILNFGISELEIFGEGYPHRARYISKVIDLEGRANFGKIKIAAEVEPGASLVFKTRTGKSPKTLIYYKKTGIEGVLTEVSESEYKVLQPSGRGGIVNNTEDWSCWSAPYAVVDLLEGTQMASPGNRRYLQFSIDLLSSTLMEKASVDFMSLEYSTAPVAHEIVGEIVPAEAAVGEETLFTYYVRGDISGEDTGFDALEVQTPVRATVEELRIGGSSVAYTVEAEDSRFVVYFPEHKVEGGDLVELSFRSSVFAWTKFAARAFYAQAGELPQDILPGDATEKVDTNDISVATIRLGGEVFQGVEVVPNPFTPNGDGLNDEAVLSFNLLKVDQPTPVNVGVYDLSGRLVRELYASRDISGPKRVTWDGRDGDGALMQPGIYLFKLTAEADKGTRTEVGTVVLTF